MDVVRPARGDFGATITFAMRKRDDTVFDISTATSLKAYLSKPDGVVLSKDGTVVGDGSAGQFTVTLADGDLNQDGDHMLEPDIIFSGAKYGGMPFRFRVRSSARS